MGKCKDCEFWKLIPPAGSCFQAGECSRLVLVSKKDDDRQLCTESTFSCTYFKRKQHGPFTIKKHKALTYNYWYIAFNDQICPTLFSLETSAKRWRDWLNSLWAQKDRERPCLECEHWIYEDDDHANGLGECDYISFCDVAHVLKRSVCECGYRIQEKACSTCDRRNNCLTRKITTGFSHPDREDCWERKETCSTCYHWRSARLWCDKGGHGANLNDSCRFWKGKGK